MHGLDWGKATTIFSTILSRVADFIHLKLSFLFEQTTNQHSIHWKGWMQCMAAGIHDFTVTDNQKNPMQELIVWWIARALSEISEEMIASTFLKCIN